MLMMSASCDVVTIFRRIMCPFLMDSCVKYLRMTMCLALSWPSMMLLLPLMQVVLCSLCSVVAPGEHIVDPD